ncbi:MAG TPA: site-2 protease family protein, partial [Gemmatimonadaceae bacterium]|nr:site-2 protease family protein [Gemmatimonadaceae bacterium]
ARRLAYFWLVWSGLLLVHEAGHALSALEQGLEVRRVTVGVGPVLWRGEHPEAQLVLRLVPIAGVTSVDAKLDASPGADADAWSEWSRHGATLAGGVIATLAAALALAIVVAARERRSGRRWVLARMVIADAVVLTVFNFLPVPPLDGGRAVLAAVSAWRGTPLSGDALFWVQLGGLALAVVPMTLWTRWTARIDALALWWRAPKRAS